MVPSAEYTTDQLQWHSIVSGSVVHNNPVPLAMLSKPPVHFVDSSRNSLLPWEVISRFAWQMLYPVDIWVEENMSRSTYHKAAMGRCIHLISPGPTLMMPHRPFVSNYTPLSDIFQRCISIIYHHWTPYMTQPAFSILHASCFGCWLWVTMSQCWSCPTPALWRTGNDLDPIQEIRIELLWPVCAILTWYWLKWCVAMLEVLQRVIPNLTGAQD